MRMLSERAIEVQHNLNLCFIDFEKAFDRVKHKDLIKMLQNIGVDGKDLRLIRNLYWNQVGALRIGDKLTPWRKTKRGVRQGYVMSPDLFALYSETILRSIREAEGIKIGGVNVNNIRYADDTVLIADTEEKLQTLLTAVHDNSNEYGIRINIRKTETMTMSKNKPPNM